MQHLIKPLLEIIKDLSAAMDNQAEINENLNKQINLVDDKTTLIKEMIVKIVKRMENYELKK